MGVNDDTIQAKQSLFDRRKFLPTHLPIDGANSLSTTKWQSRCITPSRQWHSASKPIPWDILLNQYVKRDLKIMEENQKTLMPPWTSPNCWPSTQRSKNAVKNLQQIPVIQSAWWTWYRQEWCMQWWHVSWRMCIASGNAFPNQISHGIIGRSISVMASMH